VSASEQMPAELEQLQAELESEKENYENARSAVEQAELARERKKKHLREGHEIYESRLALKIQASKNGEASLAADTWWRTPYWIAKRVRLCLFAILRAPFVFLRYKDHLFCVRASVSYHSRAWALSRVRVGNIVMKMHKIDPKNPSRQFYFSIVVIGDKYSGAAAKCPRPRAQHMRVRTILFIAILPTRSRSMGFHCLCSVANIRLPQSSVAPL